MKIIYKLKQKIRKYNREKISLNYTYKKAIHWIKKNTIHEQGIVVSSRNKVSYPEVTGYTIPTLYQWGEKELARKYTKWLVSIQNDDGSFSGVDGIPYTFDTGQVVRGLVSALDDLPEVKNSLRKACDWMLTQIQPNGKLVTPSTEIWSDNVDDRIHLYVLPPLIEASKKLNEPKYYMAAKRILEYYKKREDLVKFNMINHFFAYVIEALCDLNEKDIIKEGIEHITILQMQNGKVPAYKNVSWVCSTGLAQLAVIWYKLGMNENADKAMHYLEQIQNRSGGFTGSYGKGKSYFPEEEISWAVKYFLDAYYWKIQKAFNKNINYYPEKINENDGRVQEIISFFGDLNGKKIIDVGCGKGRFLRVIKEKFPNSQLYGLDISEKMLQYCPDGVETKIGSTLDIKYPDGYFDYVYTVEVLEHALMVENAIKEMIRILKIGGKIVIIDKNVSKLGRLELADWEQWFKPKDIVKLLRKHGITASFNPIAYDDQIHPDGLFIAWEGLKT